MLRTPGLRHQGMAMLTDDRGHVRRRRCPREKSRGCVRPVMPGTGRSRATRWRSPAGRQRRAPSWKTSSKARTAQGLSAPHGCPAICRRSARTSPRWMWLERGVGTTRSRDDVPEGGPEVGWPEVRAAFQGFDGTDEFRTVASSSAAEIATESLKAISIPATPHTRARGAGQESLGIRRALAITPHWRCLATPGSVRVPAALAAIPLLCGAAVGVLLEDSAPERLILAAALRGGSLRCWRGWGSMQTGDSKGGGLSRSCSVPAAAGYATAAAHSRALSAPTLLTWFDARTRPPIRPRHSRWQVAGRWGGRRVRGAADARCGRGERRGAARREAPGWRPADGGGNGEP